MANLTVQRIGGAVQGIYNSVAGILIGWGSGNPNSKYSAGVGSVYYRTDLAGVPYYKKTGSGNTGWFSGICEDFASPQTVLTSGILALQEGCTVLPVAGNGGAVTGVGVQAGTFTGQKIRLLGTDATNTVTLSDNAGNVKLGAATRALALNDNLELVFDGTNWIECNYTAVG